MRSFFLLSATILGVVFGGVPDKCKNPPKVPLEACCEGYHMIFTDEILKDCAFDSMNDTDIKCEPFVCMMKKYAALGSDNKINRAKAKEILSKTYVGDWSSVVTDVATKCFSELDSHKSDCESKAFGLCFVEKAIDKCPQKYWNNTKECNDAKLFMTECAKELV